jgi:DNA-directed RNA polymerase specialized sigma subunit
MQIPTSFLASYTEVFAVGVAAPNGLPNKLTEYQYKLCEDNIRLMYSAMHNFNKKYGSSIQDIHGLCVDSLCEAAKRYDPSRGTAFSTLFMLIATRAVYGELRKIYKSREISYEEFTKAYAKNCKPLDHAVHKTTNEWISVRINDDPREITETAEATARIRFAIRKAGRTLSSQDIAVLHLMARKKSDSFIAREIMIPVSLVRTIKTRIRAQVSRYMDEAPSILIAHHPRLARRQTP